MILLNTGLPGSSKTLNAIKRICEDELYINRPVYYFNIKEVTLPDWQELTEEQAKEWYKLPSGSVVLLDECQRLFRPQRHDAKVPKHWEELETHRHLGIDLVLCTQHPSLIDTKVRRQVGRHIHFERVFGLDSANTLSWEKAQTSVDDYHIRKDAIKKRVSFDKKYYGTYKSAEIHTVKKQLPKAKLFGIAAAGILSIALIISVISSFGDEKEEVKPVPANISESSFLPQSPSPSSKDNVLTKAQYIELYTPRVANIPESAPIYDEVREVNTYPRPQCIKRVSTGDCRCFSQQATPLNISLQQCFKIVEQGYFDPSKSESTTARTAAGPSASGVSIAHQRILSALEIKRSSNATF